MPDFKPGDAVIDVRCRHRDYCTDGKGLRGVVSRVSRDQVWGDWLYRDKWTYNRHSSIEVVRLLTGDEADAVIASWTVWRLNDG